MKKFLVCFAILLSALLFGCSDGEKSVKKDQTEPISESVSVEDDTIDPSEEIIYVEDSEVKFRYRSFNEGWIEQAYQVDAIPTKKAAVEVATAIFKNVLGDWYEEGNRAKVVTYDPLKEVWVVTFWGDWAYDDEGRLACLGGDCSIALQKSDGKVLCICFGD